MKPLDHAKLLATLRDKGWSYSADAYGNPRFTKMVVGFKIAITRRSTEWFISAPAFESDAVSSLKDALDKAEEFENALAGE